MKSIPKSPTPLDQEVAAMITRLGMEGPLDSIASYTVKCRPGDFTRVVVEFIADEGFNPGPVWP